MSSFYPEEGVENQRESGPLPRKGHILRSGMLRHWSRYVIDFLYPPACANCDAPISEAQALCAQCWSAITLIDRPYCERLGVPLPGYHDGPILSPAAIANPPIFQRARSVCLYDDMARKLVQRLKYGDKTELGLLMGRMMAAAGRELLTSCDVIVPVPLHRFRLWRRRYNQAAILADVVALQINKKSEPFLLRRVRHTRSQTSLNHKQRQNNLQGAFDISPSWRGRLSEARILLVDDVLTSGATVNAAANALLRSGAATVDVLTFAHVVKD